MTVVQYEQPQPLPPSQPGDELEPGPRGWVAKLRGAAEIAGYIADTDFVPTAYRGNPSAIAAAILYGDEIGLGPMQSLAKIAVIKGRPTLTAEAQRGLIAAAGHELWFDESTTTRAIAAGRRRDSDRVGRVTWTLDDAKRAGIAGQPNWRAYPAEMLRARASAALARAMFADVIGGMPAAEELEGEPDNGPPDAGPPQPPPADLPPTPAPTRTRRRRAAPRPARAAAEPVTAPPPLDPQPEPDIPPEPPATDAQKRQIFAAMRDVGFPAADREARLAYTRRVAERPTLASSNELTLAEAGRVIDDLDEIKALPPDKRPARLRGDVAAADTAQAPADPERAPEAGGAAGPPTAPEGGGSDDAQESAPGDEPGPVPYNEFPPGF